MYNPTTLAIAREARGLTQSALAKVLGISQGKVSRVEEGLVELSSVDVIQWASALDVDPGRLSLRTTGADTPALSFFRRTQTIPLKLIRQGNAVLQLRRAEILHRLAGRPLGDGPRLPHISVTSASEAAEAAQKIRHRWNIPYGPLLNLVARIEQAGCFVEYRDFKVPKIDAVAIGGGSGCPTIFLSPNFPPDRTRLSLAHELGHIVMHREAHDGVEAEAWAFAAELMMPEIDIRRDLYPLDIDKLLKLKVKWQVSMQALLKRARDLDRISERYSQFLWMRLGQYGFRTTEPGGSQILNEKPKELNEWLTA